MNKLLDLTVLAWALVRISEFQILAATFSSSDRLKIQHAQHCSSGFMTWCVSSIGISESPSNTVICVWETQITSCCVTGLYKQIEIRFWVYCRRRSGRSWGQNWRSKYEKVVATFRKARRLACQLLIQIILHLKANQDSISPLMDIVRGDMSLSLHHLHNIFSIFLAWQHSHMHQSAKPTMSLFLLFKAAWPRDCLAFSCDGVVEEVKKAG